MAVSRGPVFLATAILLAFGPGPAGAEPFKLKIACTATSDCASAMVAATRACSPRTGSTLK